MNNYWTLDILGTFAGVVAAVTLIVQFLKLPIDKIWEIPTRFVVWFISALILFALAIINGTLTANDILLIVLNSIVVTVAAMGAYELTFKKLGG